MNRTQGFDLAGLPMRATHPYGRWYTKGCFLLGNRFWWTQYILLLYLFLSGIEVCPRTSSIKQEYLHLN